MNLKAKNIPQVAKLIYIDISIGLPKVRFSTLILIGKSCQPRDKIRRIAQISQSCEASTI
jgi:hypothetical protein